MTRINISSEQISAALAAGERVSIAPGISMIVRELAPSTAPSTVPSTAPSTAPSTPPTAAPVVEPDTMNIDWILSGFLADLPSSSETKTGGSTDEKQGGGATSIKALIERVFGTPKAEACPVASNSADVESRRNAQVRQMSADPKYAGRLNTAVSCVEFYSRYDTNLMREHGCDCEKSEVAAYDRANVIVLKSKLELLGTLMSLAAGDGPDDDDVPDLVDA